MIYTGRRKRGVEKNTIKTTALPMQNNDANLPVKRENKLFDTSKNVTNKFDVIKPQSVLDTHKSPTHTIHSYQVSILQSMNLLIIFLGIFM